MTSRQILNFLNSDEAKNAKITKLSFTNGEMVKVFFNRNDQIKELADDNVWRAMTADHVHSLMEFDGENLKSITIENISTALAK